MPYHAHSYPDPTWHATYYPNALNADSATPIKLSAGDEFHADLQIVKIDGVSVSGTVRPMPANGFVSVMLTEQTSPNLQSFLSGTATRNGEFSFSNVAPGSYVVTARAVETDPLTKKVTFAKGALRRVQVSEQTTRLDLSLSAIPDLKGTVTFEEGCTPTPVRVFVGGALSETATDGAFTFTGMAPGTIRTWVAPVNESMQVSSASIRLGNREVTHEWFDYPGDGSPELNIVMKCATGVRQ